MRRRKNTKKLAEKEYFTVSEAAYILGGDSPNPKELGQKRKSSRKKKPHKQLSRIQALGYRFLHKKGRKTKKQRRYYIN